MAAPEPQEQGTQDGRRINSDFYVEGLATTFGGPYEMAEIDGIKYYEQIDRHALDEADLSDVIMQYDHEGKVLARQSNGTLIVEPHDDGLFMAADLSKSTAAKEMYEEVKNGLITQMSWGFQVISDEYDVKTHTRTILKIKKVFDVSAVSIPVNASTTITARSYAEGRAEVEKQELLERRRKSLLLKIKIGGMLNYDYQRN